MIRVRAKEHSGIRGYASDLVAHERAEAERVVNDGVQMLGAAVRRNLSVRRGRPAAEGESPSLVTGGLLRSVREESPQWDGDTVRGAVVVDDPRAGRMEFGGLGIKPHPFMRPAFARVVKAITSMMKAVRP